MKPSDFKFSKGKLVPQIKGGIISLAKLLGQMGIGSITGAVEAKQTPDGWNLYFPPKASAPSRSYVIGTAVPTTLPATILLSEITYDVPSARTASLLGSVSAGVFEFTKPGFYLVKYAASISMDLSGATTATPDPVACTATIRIGGTDIPSTESKTSHPKTPNFDGFVTNPDGTIEQTVDVSGATGKTAPFSVSVVAICDGSSVDIGGATGVSDSGYVTLDSPQVFDVTNTCVDVIGTTTLDGSLQQSITLDNQTPLDITSSLDVIEDSDPSGTGYGTITGQALIRVIRNSSGDIKILDGVTERSPTVEIYATNAGGDATCLTATLSILKL